MGGTNISLDHRLARLVFHPLVQIPDPVGPRKARIEVVAVLLVPGGNGEMVKKETSNGEMGCVPWVDGPEPGPGQVLGPVKRLEVVLAGGQVRPLASRTKI